MHAPHSYDAFLQLAIEMRMHGADDNTIRKKLESMKMKSESITLIFEDLKKIKFEKRKKRGRGILIAGLITLLTGFITTIILHYSNSSFSGVMYSFTTGGIILVLIGSVDLLGW